jgi:amidophosphoribosyltransferase
MFNAVTQVTKRVKGSYAVVSLIAGYGLLAFRDPFGIRPLCIGRLDTPKGPEWMIASESVALDGLGYTFVRDVNPGEAIYIDLDGNFYSRQCVADAVLTPCIFEYVYMARPDSTIDGVTVYNVRMRMGDYLAEKIRKETIPGEIDVVMPIPDSSRPAAMQVAKRLGVDYREGFFKNRYIGRTFIMPGQAVRKKSVRQKLNAMRIEFKDKTVLIVDDSIVRGTTSFEIVQMARESGAKKVICLMTHTDKSGGKKDSLTNAVYLYATTSISTLTNTTPAVGVLDTINCTGAFSPCSVSISGGAYFVATIIDTNQVSFAVPAVTVVPLKVQVPVVIA